VLVRLTTPPPADKLTPFPLFTEPHPTTATMESPS
jgi:hypothetical protein